MIKKMWGEFVKILWHILHVA